MLRSASYPVRQSSRLNGEMAFALGFAALALVFSIDSRSLWIDEFNTWVLTRHERIGDWWVGFLDHPDSDNQQPLYHLYVFVWCKIFGTSELALRAANAPMLLVAVWAIMQAPLDSRLKLTWAGVLCLHSFTWYYLNEARPYIMLVAGASLGASGWIFLLRSLETSSVQELRRGLVLYAWGALLVVGANVIGSLWVASSGLAILYLYRNRLDLLWTAIKAAWYWLAICATIGGVMLGIASYSFTRGVRAASMGFSLSAFAYGIVEVLGTAGLGPGRNDLRKGLGDQSLIALLPMLAASIVGALTVAIAVMRQRSGYLLVSVLVTVGPLLVLIVIGQALGMRILGRHFALLLLPITLAYAFMFYALPTRRTATWLLAFLAPCLVLSSLMVRLSDEHHKDSYADAAAIAREVLDKGKVIWWVADLRGADYYGLIPERPEQAKGRKFEFDFVTPRHVDDISKPDAIFMSKPEFDRQGIARRYIAAQNLVQVHELPAFSVFARSASALQDTVPGLPN